MMRSYDITAGTTALAIHCLRSEDEEKGSIASDGSYDIVGSSQADIMNNKISDESPVGMALKGAKVGEEVLVEAPDGEFKYRVLDIKRQEL